MGNKIKYTGWMVRVFILLLGYGISYAQQLPALQLQQREFNIPSNLLGTQPDEGALKGNNYVYKLNAQVFSKNTLKIPAGNTYKPVKDGKSPLELVAALVFAFRNNDFELMNSLYDASAFENGKQVMTRERFNQMSDIVKQYDSFYYDAVFEFKGGYYVFTTSAELGTQINYIIKKDNRYYLMPTRLTEKCPVNMLAYFSYKPEPFKKPEFTSRQDSVKADDKPQMEFKVSRKDNFLVLFRGKEMSQVLAVVGDNYDADINRSDAMVKFEISLGYYIDQGANDLYALESNYPVTFVTREMIDKALKFKVHVK